MMYYINSNRWTLRNKKTTHRFLMSKGTPVYLAVESEENILEESLDGLTHIPHFGLSHKK